MGVVYEATQLSLERVVALKVLASHLSDDIGFQQRFRREGQIQGGIDHPHIITVYDSGQTEHGFFIAMRLVRGPNLKDMILARQLDAGRTMRILTPVAEALDTAHAAGLIHRDIKPQNILVGGRDHAFLADFGLTKATGERSLTRTGQFVGTLDYISPEQIRGESATIQSDVYALAGVLYECLTGVVPFPKESEAAVLYAHMADPPPRVTEQRPDLPAQLDAVLTRAMSKDPSERPRSATELLLEVNHTFSRRMRAAFTPPGPIEIPEETGIRQPEVDVPTREAPAKPAEPAPETRAAPVDRAPPAPVELAGSAPREASDARVAPEAAPPTSEPTRVSPAEPTRAADEPDSTPPAETRHGPAETRLGPAETRAARAEAEATRLSRAESEAAAVQRGTSRGRRADPVAAAAGSGAAAGAVHPHAPSRARRQRRREASPGLLAAAAGLLLALLVGGFLLGRSGGGEEPAPQRQPVAAGSLAISVPDNWNPVASAFAIPGLELDGAVTLAPGGDAAQGALTVGTTRATGRTLLPASFLDRLPEAPAQDDAVQLGDLEAYRYAGLRPQGFDRRSTIYVAPTTEGVATVTCAGPRSAPAAFLTSCEEAATTLRLESGSAFALGHDDDYASDLNAAIDRLNAARGSGTRALRRARTARGQARAAQGLARSHRRIAASLADVTISPELAPANTRVVGALRDSAAAYERLAARAREVDRAGYRHARRQVERAESRLRRALRTAGR
jgi:hypothetical protein